MHPHMHKVWQHHVLNAVPTLGMALPLLRALGWRQGRRDMRFVHTGALHHSNVHLPGAQWLLSPATRDSGRRSRAARLDYMLINRTERFALAFAVPRWAVSSEVSRSDRLGTAVGSGSDTDPTRDRALNPVPSLPGTQWSTRALEVAAPEVAMPLSAYWPYEGRKRPGVRTPFVAFVSRQNVSSGRRRLADEEGVLVQLRHAFRSLRIPFATFVDAPATSYLDACGVRG
jgi:hypothetical protein